MSPQMASSWLNVIKSLHRYTSSTIDHSDAASVRQANIEAEEYAKIVAPNLTAIAQEVDSVQPGRV